MYRLLFTIITILLILIVYKNKVSLLLSNSINRCKQIEETFQVTTTTATEPPPPPEFNDFMKKHNHYYEKQIVNLKDNRRRIVENESSDIEKIRSDMDTLNTGTNKELPCIYYRPDNCPQHCISKTGDKNSQCGKWAARTPSECEDNPAYMLPNCAKSCESYFDNVPATNDICVPEPGISLADDIPCELFSKYGDIYCNNHATCIYNTNSKRCETKSNCDVFNDNETGCNKNLKCVFNTKTKKCVNKDDDDEEKFLNCNDKTDKNTCNVDETCEYNSTLNKCVPNKNEDETNICSRYNSIYTNDEPNVFEDKIKLCNSETEKECRFFKHKTKLNKKFSKNKYFGACVDESTPEFKRLIKDPKFITRYDGDINDVNTVKENNRRKKECERLGSHYEWSTEDAIENEYRCVPKCERLINETNCSKDPEHCFYDKTDDLCKLKCGKNNSVGCLKNNNCYWEDSGNTGYCHSLTKENNEEICAELNSDCTNNLNCYLDGNTCKAKDTDLEIMGGLLSNYQEFKEFHNLD